MEIKIRKLTHTAKTSTKGSEGAAAFDLCADLSHSVVVDPGETAVIPTGISMAIPKGYAGFVYARSGLATLEGLRPANCVGVVDSDYRGDIRVPIYNDSPDDDHIDEDIQAADGKFYKFVEVKMNE